MYINNCILNNEETRIVELLSSKIGFNELNRIKVFDYSDEKLTKLEIRGKEKFDCETHLCKKMLKVIENWDGNCVKFMNRHIAVYDYCKYPHNGYTSFLMINVWYEII